MLRDTLGGARGRIRTGNLSLIWRSRPKDGSAYKAAALTIELPGREHRARNRAHADGYEEMVGERHDADTVPELAKKCDGVAAHLRWRS